MQVFRSLIVAACAFTSAALPFAVQAQGKPEKAKVSIAVGGKSAAERKREAAIDSVNRVILARLQDRARLLRDSLRADSLRRDSLAKRIRS